MKKAVALLMLATPLMFAMPSPAAAGGSEDAALALGAFAVFNQLVRGETVLHDLFGRPVVREQVVVQPPVVYAPPPPPAVVYWPAAPPTVIYAPAPPPAVVYAPPPVVVHRGGYWAYPDRGGYWAYRGGHRVWVAHPVRHRGNRW